MLVGVVLEVPDRHRRHRGDGHRPAGLALTHGDGGDRVGHPYQRVSRRRGGGVRGCLERQAQQGGGQAHH